MSWLSMCIRTKCCFCASIHGAAESYLRWQRRRRWEQSQHLRFRVAGPLVLAELVRRSISGHAQETLRGLLGAGYCRFVVALYVVFVNLVLWVPEANDVVQSLTLAIKTPTFRKLYPLSGVTRL